MFNASGVEQDMKKLLHSSLNPLAMRKFTMSMTRPRLTSRLQPNSS